MINYDYNHELLCLNKRNQKPSNRLETDFYRTAVHHLHKRFQTCGRHSLPSGLYGCIFMIPGKTACFCTLLTILQQRYS